MRRPAGPLLLAVALTLVCTGVVPVPAVAAAPGPDPTSIPNLAPLPRVDAASPSLSPSGREQLRRADLEDAPRASVSAVVDPVTGVVDGRYRARLARPAGGTLHLRMLAGLRSYRAGLEVHAARLDGKPVDVTRVDARLDVAVPRGLHPFVEVALDFSYRIPRAADTRGRLLTPATIGVLTRHPGTLLLGHWIPLWIPPRADPDADLSGYGDIGNFAAGAITVRVAVPAGYSVYGPGTLLDERVDDAGTTVVTRSGVGLRDLSLVVARGLVSAAAPVGDATVHAAVRPGGDAQAAADAAAASLSVLESLFGPYPWSELAAIDVPLGPQVGGMEWPGAIWIDGFRGAPGVDDVVAHELAHQYWHALVGNDSIAAAVVDEPLAQYSACLVARASGGDARSCRFDAPLVPRGAAPCIDRPTDEFGPGEYGELVYGEAPAFYLELEELLGVDGTVAALRQVVDRHAFGVLTAAELRDELAAAAPERAATITDLWDGIIGSPGCAPTR